jgi:TolB protein
LDTGGNVISSFQSPRSTPFDLAQDGGYLWCIDGVKIFRKPSPAPVAFKYDEVYCFPKRCRMQSKDKKLVVMITLISLLSIFLVFSTSQVKAEAQSQTTLVVKEVKQLTNDPKMWHQEPSWSPDGEKIVFSARVLEFSEEEGRELFGDSDIWIMDFDGSNKKRLTDDPDDEFSPSFSPDGKKITYLKGNYGRYGNLWVIDIDGSNKKMLAERVSDPVWSPDSKKIASGTRIINVDGSGEKLLTNISSKHSSWSPDGKRIVFSSGFYPDERIWIVNSDGSDLEQLTFGPESDAYPSFSPDGKKIAFFSELFSLRIMDVDGSNRRRLGGGNPYGASYSWSTDGGWITYQAGGEWMSHIWIVNITDGNVTQLTNGDVKDDHPIWSPDGKKIAFVRYEWGSEYPSQIWLIIFDETASQAPIPGFEFIVATGVLFLTAHFILKSSRRSMEGVKSNTILAMTIVILLTMIIPAVATPTPHWPKWVHNPFLIEQGKIILYEDEYENSRFIAEFLDLTDPTDAQKWTYLKWMMEGASDADEKVGPLGQLEHCMHPYDHHTGCILGWRSAGDLAESKFKDAISYWNQGILGGTRDAVGKPTEEGAMYNLGWVAHLVQDQTVPHHARKGDKESHDTYEEWVNWEVVKRNRHKVDKKGTYNFHPTDCGTTDPTHCNDGVPLGGVDYNAHESYQDKYFKRVDSVIKCVPQRPEPEQSQPLQKSVVAEVQEVKIPRVEAKVVEKLTATYNKKGA